MTSPRSQADRLSELGLDAQQPHCPGGFARKKPSPPCRNGPASPLACGASVFCALGLRELCCEEAPLSQ